MVLKTLSQNTFSADTFESAVFGGVTTIVSVAVGKDYFIIQSLINRRVDFSITYNSQIDSTLIINKLANFTVER
jgi:hypothetical protein